MRRRQVRLKTWLKRHLEKETPVGDLARDAFRDPSFPWGARESVDLIGYLEARGACVDAVNTAKAAWSDWQREREAFKRAIARIEGSQ